MTITRPYTGTGIFTEPTTVETIPLEDIASGTVIVETPASFVTLTRPYIGIGTFIETTSVETIPSEGTALGTVIVEVPPTFVTVSRTHTGTGYLYGPTSVETISSEGNELGTIIVEFSPPGMVNITRPWEGNGTITKPTPVQTIPADGTTLGTIIVETPPPGPTFECDPGGYLIQGRELYRLDLSTGENVLVNPNGQLYVSRAGTACTRFRDFRQSRRRGDLCAGAQRCRLGVRSWRGQLHVQLVVHVEHDAGTLEHRYPHMGNHPRVRKHCQPEYLGCHACHERWHPVRVGEQQWRDLGVPRLGLR